MTIDACTATFEWRTYAACALEEEDGSNCQVEDPNTGYLYDLTTLMQDEDYM